MSAHLQIRMLRTMCNQIDAMIAEGGYGEFLVAGMKVARDVACRTANQLDAEDKALAATVERKPGDLEYNPKGKPSGR